MNSFIPFNLKYVCDIDLSKEKNINWILGRESSVSREEVWIKYLFDLGCNCIVQVPNGIVSDTYIDEPSYMDALKKFELILKNKWDNHMNEYLKLKKRMIDCAKEVSTLTKSNDNNLILKKYKVFLDTSYEFCEYIWAAWVVVFHVEKSVIKHFSNKIDLIMALDEPIEYLNMLNDLFYLNNKELVKKHGWQKAYNSFDEIFTEQDFEKLRKETDKEEIEKQFEGFKIMKMKFNNFLDTIEDENLRLDIEMVHKYAFLKTDRIDAWKKSMFYLREFHNYVARLANLGVKDAANMFSSEIIDFLNTGNIPNNLNYRSQNRVLYYYRNNCVKILYEQSNVNKIIKELKGKEEVNELKGMTACKGKVRGVVKVVYDSNELDKVNEGDIFIAKFTYPTYTPKMIKSLAIITDEGGITTHAAIIAREYNIPCVIGTKIATSVLKDGDLVEVDADKGVVRKIS